MKRTFTFGIISAAILVLVVGCASSAHKYASPSEWIAQSMTGNQLPLGEKAGVWSGPKTFILNNNGGTVQVKSEFLKHHGSTCHFNVSISNVGQTTVKAVAGLTTQERVNVYAHNAANLNLAPGKTVIYDDLEARECPIRFGTSEDMNACAACRAWFLFAQ